MIHNYLPVIDMNYGRIKETIETGNDPGEEGAWRRIAEAAGAGGGLPPALIELLRRLRGGKAGDEEEEEEEGKGEGEDEGGRISRI